MFIFTAGALHVACGSEQIGRELRLPLYDVPFVTENG